MDFHITRIEQVYYDNLAGWYKQDLKDSYQEELKAREQAGFAKIKRTPEKDPDPTGPGWVVELRGYHYYNGKEKQGREGAAHVTNYLVEFLENGTIKLPGVKPGEVREITMYDLGVRRPVLRNRAAQPNRLFRLPNPEYVRLMEERGLAPKGGAGGLGLGSGGPNFGSAGLGTGGSGASLDGEGPGGGAGLGLGGGPGRGGSQGGSNKEPLKDDQGNLVPADFEAPKFDFIVQFAWKPGALATVTGPAVAASAAPSAAPAGNFEEESTPQD